MADLSEGQVRKIDELAIAGAPKPVIAGVIHCSTSTVYRKLDDLHPRDGRQGSVKLRTRKTGNYHADEQTMYRIRKHVLANRFCINKQIISDLELKVKSIVTISKYLKQMGIGTYIAATNQFLSPENIDKRLVRN